MRYTEIKKIPRNTFRAESMPKLDSYRSGNSPRNNSVMSSPSNIKTMYSDAVKQRNEVKLS